MERECAVGSKFKKLTNAFWKHSPSPQLGKSGQIRWHGKCPN